MALKDYYRLAKPGLVYGNLIPLVAGFALAAKGNVTLVPFFATTIGASLGMASGCVFNNVIDHDIDAKMRRTRHRAVPAGRITRRAAFVYGAALGIAGTAILAAFASIVAAIAGAVGFVFYVFLYSMWWKRRSPWGTLVGSVSGAMPPVVGYTAVTGRIDAAAVILFASMVAWQMPHFFAIAIRHADDYAAAGIPVLPAVRGLRAAKVQMLLYVIAFAALAPLLAVAGYAGRAYLAVTLTLGLSWLGLALNGLRIPDGHAKNAAWARDMFVASLVVMIALYATIALTSVA